MRAAPQPGWAASAQTAGVIGNRLSWLYRMQRSRGAAMMSEKNRVPSRQRGVGCEDYLSPDAGLPITMNLRDGRKSIHWCHQTRKTGS